MSAPLVELRRGVGATRGTGGGAGLRVLFVTSAWPSPERPAYGVFTQRQVHACARAGARCDVLVIGGRRGLRAYALAAGRLLALGLAPRPRYDVVHAQGGEAALAARAFLGAPVVATYLGSDLLGARRSRLARALVAQASRLMAGIVVQSEEMAGRLPPAARRRAMVQPHGIDLEQFRPLPRTVARRQLGWRGDGRTVLFASDPSVAVKRFALASQASRLGAERAPHELRVVSGVAPTTMPVVLSAADCLLLTSASEGSPNVVKEALACNLPVVATDVGDVSRLLGGVEPSAVCPPDPAALADGVVRVLSSGRRSDGRAAVERLAWPAVTDRLLAYYAALLAPRGRGRR